ncbi:sigma-70 family RNA polymerase sigma factor [Nocardia callitridis]|uniref:Sigma-70 family RNA polymerase sigma factor n=1 Tax=Nocardia callitridis TaxID=648753 RepID=A0ABP9KP43_9NOCA
MAFSLDSTFDSERRHLTAVAFRLLGSLHDAEDAVQDTWIKAATADAGDVRNPAAWLTTILTRVCLDRLRTRQRRGEHPLRADPTVTEAIAADEHYIGRERVSRALMVVLDQLTPPQRVAYILHDLFDFPFRQVADALGISSDAAKQHASRARRRIETSRPDTTPNSARDDALVEAFLAAAAGGDLNRMLSLMAPDCVRHADPALLPDGAQRVVAGAASVAEETRLFAGRIRSSTAIVIDGRPAHGIAPGGHLLAIIDITAKHGLITRIDITRPTARPVLTMAPTTTCPA